MRYKAFIFCLAIVFLLISPSTAQDCNILSKANNIVPDKLCAPVSVDWQVTYRGVSAAATTVEILFDWDDGTMNTLPAVLIDPVTREFEATFMNKIYPSAGNRCNYLPTAFLVIDGTTCTSTAQEQTVTVWDTDDQNGGDIIINPQIFRVCEGTAATVAFTDNSTFNCVPPQEIDVPNTSTRWVQWLYGTTTNPGPYINGITVNDAPPVTIPPTPTPYAGPIVTLPGPVTASGEVSFNIDVPNTPAVGEIFEVTLNNWNFCNPYEVGGIPTGNPPVTEVALIEIVQAPAPNYSTWKNSIGGIASANFCLNETIFFENTTGAIGGAAFNYSWEFYDDPGGATLLSTSNATNPTFAYGTSGMKLVRLRVTDGNAAGTCESVFDSTVEIFPSVIAGISMTAVGGAPVISGEFCQDNALSQTFMVQFNDVSASFNPSTEWTWEVYDENNVLVNTFGPFNTPGTNIVESYVNPGTYRVRLETLDTNVPECVTTDEAFVHIYQDPDANFNATTECNGDFTQFTDATTLNVVNGNSIISYEWDFGDGFILTPGIGAIPGGVHGGRTIGTYDNPQHQYIADGNYNVTMTATTDMNGCFGAVTLPVVVDPLPLTTFTRTGADDCSDLTVLFDITAIGLQPATVVEYTWQVDEDATGTFVDELMQDPADPGFINPYSRTFVNNTVVNKVYDVRLKAVTVDGCEAFSPIETVTVFPAPKTGFSSPNYNPLADNCSPQTIDFEADPATQALAPDSYNWTILDGATVVSMQNTLVPQFSYQFVNTDLAIRTFTVTAEALKTGFCFRDSSVQVRISPVPLADFVIDTTQFDCDIMAINVDATQKGNSIHNWQIIRDGVPFNSTSLGDNFDFQFTRPPDGAAATMVEIRLQTTNFANCISTQTIQNFTVPDTETINAAFTATPLLQVLPNSTITVTNQTNAGPWNYQWDFGDGVGTSTLQNPAPYDYGTFGNFDITLIASGNFCADTITVPVEIQPAIPIIDFDFDPPNGCVPLTVTFTNTSQFAEDSSYVWNFGDGNGPLRAISPVYTYTDPGIYTVSLTGQNVQGVVGTETKSMIIEVFPVPIASFQIRPETVFIPTDPIFTDNNSFGATEYLWDFGDGNTSNEFEPTHTFDEAGFYSITLIATNQLGCSDTLRFENAVEATTGGNVLVPNAFTPSGDGPNGGVPGAGGAVNDVFLPLTEGVVEFNMLIYNRWGELLFESDNREIGWDGYYRGKLMPQDIYVYKLTMKLTDGNTVVRVGDVNLLR